MYDSVCTGVERLRSDLNRYVWWYDRQRLRSTLDYMSPVEFTQQGNTLQEQSNTPLPIQPHAMGNPGLIDDWLAGSRPELPLSADDVKTAILRGAYPTQRHETIAWQYREALTELEQYQRDADLLAAHTQHEAH